MAKSKKGSITILIIAAIVILFAAEIILTSNKTTNQANATQLANQSDPYANLGTASFALVAQQSVLANNQRFVSLAKSKYNFLYANASGFASVKSSPFIVLVVNGSNATSENLALDAINSTALGYAFNSTKGIIISRNNVWAQGQTVFILAGYRNANALSSALLSFFLSAPVYAPRQAVSQFVAFNGIAKRFNGTGGIDPVMDAYLGGTYELGPHDSALGYPYNYYLKFAYLLYYAPIIYSGMPGAEGNASGSNLPMDAFICLPPPPPPDGSSVCVGDYVAMPILQVGVAPPIRPQWSYDSGDCTFLLIADCVDAEGWAASGINPQLPYGEIPSVVYGLTATGSGVPPSMTGTSGPISPAIPITWWVYGPGSLGESTGGFQGSIITQNQTQILMKADVEMFSAPTSETLLGSFTPYNDSSSTYSCSSALCGMSFNYSIYALLNVSSTIPDSAGPTYSNYSAVLRPVTLSAPKIVKTSSKTYYFSYWSVDSELAGSQYYQQFNTSNATFQVIGPTQAQAVYTSGSASGRITFLSGIPGIIVSVVGSGGRQIYSNTTGISGQAVTPALPGGCYQVTAHKSGYILITGPNPVCVNGPASVLIKTWSPLVYGASWPSSYPYGGAPVNTSIPINLTLLYSSGLLRAGNVTIGVSTDTGYVSGTLPQPANGTLCTRWYNGYNYQTTCGNVSRYSLALTNGAGSTDFVWHTGKISGIYYLNFTPLVDAAGGPYVPLLGYHYGWTYSMPVVVYSSNYSQVLLNVSLAKSRVAVQPGSSFTDTISVRACQFGFNLGSNATLMCDITYPANMLISGLPPNVTAKFSPNPAVALPGNINESALLNITLGSRVKAGSYTSMVTGTITVGNATYHASAPLTINVSSSAPPSNGTGYGAFNITVFYNGSAAGGAEISAPPTYTGWYAGSNGNYYTGYTITPGNYELIGTYDNVSNSTTAAVSSGKVTYVDVYIRGATSVNSSKHYYACNLCYNVVLAGNYSCPSSCPTRTSCSYGGSECT